jgi:PGF-pre-PGF domain-containing protein
MRKYQIKTQNIAQKPRDKSQSKSSCALNLHLFLKLSAIIYLSLLFTLVFAYANLDSPLIQEGTYTQVKQFTTQEFPFLGSQSAFTKISAQFSDNAASLVYKLEESNANAFTGYRQLDITLSQNVVSTFLFSIKVARINDLQITPSNIRIYGLSGGTWTQLNATPIRSDAQFYYFNVRSSQIISLIITSAANGPGIVTQTPTSSQNNSAANQQTTTASQSSNQTTVQNPGTSQSTLLVTNELSSNKSPIPFYFVMGLVILFVVVAIIKMRPKKTIAKDVDDADSIMNPQVTVTKKQIPQVSIDATVAEMVKQGKSNGQIVSELMQQGHDISQIVESLRKNGRTLKPSD